MEIDGRPIASTYIELQRQGHQIRLDDYLRLVCELDEHLETITS